VEALFAGQALDETQWTVDGPSECLIPASATAGPFRTSVRWNAAVDRLSGVSERHSTACTEFRAGAGLWTLAAFADEAARDQWTEPVKAAFRWLADTGFGGEKSRGWGRAEAPEFKEGFLPDLVVPPAQKPAPAPVSEDPSPAEGQPEPEQQPTPEPSPPAAPAPLSNGPRPHWLLSLFTPSEADAVDWSRGNYSLVSRSGRVDGSGELKRQLQMVAEGSVLFAPEAPRGAAPDVAPEGASHPVYRCGFAVAIPLPEVA
jgi:hypothetical protein